MATIWKTQLQLTDEQAVDLPANSIPLAAHEQNGVLCVWWLVAPLAQRCKRIVAIHGTGNPAEISEHERHVGTVLMPDGMVWHVFVDDREVSS